MKSSLLFTTFLVGLIAVAHGLWLKKLRNFLGLAEDAANVPGLQNLDVTLPPVQDLVDSVPTLEELGDSIQTIQDVGQGIALSALEEVADGAYFPPIVGAGGSAQKLEKSTNQEGFDKGVESDEGKGTYQSEDYSLDQAGQDNIFDPVTEELPGVFPDNSVNIVGQQGLYQGDAVSTEAAVNVVYVDQDGHEYVRIK